MSINLSKNKDVILNAWRNVVDDKTNTNWAIFGYEGLTDVLTVVSEGDNGIDEMKEELNSGQIMYAFCKVLDPKTSLYKYVLVNWQGEGAPQLRKGVCANHIRDVSNILKGVHFTLNARTEEDVDEDIIIEKVSKSSASAYSFEGRLDLSKDGFQKMDPAYKKVEPKNEINPIERDRFWALEEAQEKQRQMEEARKKRDELLRLEEERLRRETEEAKRRELTEPVKCTNHVKKIPVVEPTVNITSKIEQIEKTKDSVEEIKERRKREAEELISQRTVDVRAVFEKNTSAGQLLNSRRYSAHSNEISETTCINNSQAHSKVNGGTEHVHNISMGNGNTETHTNHIAASNFPLSETKDEYIQNTKYQHDSSVEVNLKAVALYDYQAADDTEISFDPDDIITHIEQIDPGWWQGLAPDGSYGLFPANYVQLIP